METPLTLKLRPIAVDSFAILAVMMFPVILVVKLISPQEPFAGVPVLGSLFSGILAYPL